MSFGKTKSDQHTTNLKVDEILVVGKRIVTNDLVVSGKLIAPNSSNDNIPTGLGTAAFRNVPPAGDATATEVVLGNDTRLTNSRTPLPHAPTHSLLGSDPISIDSVQVTNF